MDDQQADSVVLGRENSALERGNCSDYIITAIGATATTGCVTDARNGDASRLESVTVPMELICTDAEDWLFGVRAGEVVPPPQPC